MSKTCKVWFSVSEDNSAPEALLTANPSRAISARDGGPRAEGRKKWGLLLSLFLVLGAPYHAQAQSCNTICAQACPSGDYTKGELQKCEQTCTTQCAKCDTTKGTGTLFPKYYILGLVYAPPGCTSTKTLACSTQSTVDYQTGSSMGTKVSTEDSYQQSVNLKLDFSLGLGSGASAFSDAFGLSASGDYSSTTTDTTSQTISKGTTLDVKATGNGDGVDHDQDVFLLLLNPAIALQQEHIFSGPGECAAGTVNWLFGINTASIPGDALYKITVGELRNPASMPADVAAQLNTLNFTLADYQTILAQDPFAGSSTTGANAVPIDPARYVPTTTAFPYEPPDQASECKSGVCTCPAIANTITNEIASDIGSSTKTEYQVGLSESLNGIDAGIFKFGETVQLNWTWTSTSTDTDMTDSKQSATASIQCPSPSYNQPETFMSVYWDKLYGSFLFVPTTLAPQTPIITQGVVTGAAGQSMPHQSIDLNFAGKTFHSYTDSNGKYVFVVPPGVTPAASGTLSVMGVNQPISMGSTQSIKVGSGGTAGATLPPSVASVISLSEFGGATSITAGGWVEIYGTNFATATSQWTGDNFKNNTAPTTLAGVQVSMNGIPAFVQYVSASQINCQVPDGVGAGDVSVVVTAANGSGNPIKVTAAARVPGLLAPAQFHSGAHQYVDAVFPDQTFVGPVALIEGLTFRPAVPGDRILLYGVGFGATSPATPAGQIANQLTTLPKVVVSFGNIPAVVEYAGAAGGYVGVDQFNVVVPNGVSGDVPLSVTVDGVPVAQQLWVNTK